LSPWQQSVGVVKSRWEDPSEEKLGVYYNQQHIL